MFKEKYQVYVVLITALMFGAAGLASGIAVYDDLWYHLLTGRYIYLHQEIPDSGFMVYNHTSMPMFYHSWLTQLFLYLVFLLGGVPLLKVLNVLLGLLAGAALYYLFRRRAGLFSFFVLLPVTVFFANFFLNLRPSVFSLIFFSVILALLHDFREKKKRVTVVLITVLMVIWTNMHGFWAFGLALTALFALDALLQKDAGEYLPLLAGGAIVLVMAFIRLGGPEAFYTLPQNGTRIIQNNVHEWYSPLYALKLFTNIKDVSTMAAVGFLRVLPPILITAVVLLILFFKKRPRIDYLLGLAFGSLTLFSARNMLFMIPVFVYIAGPVLEDYLDRRTVHKKTIVGLSLLLQVVLMTSFAINYTAFKAKPLPLENLVARLPLANNLIITHPNIADYILFLHNKDGWNQYNYVLADIRFELYEPKEMENLNGLLEGHLENMPSAGSGRLTPVFILTEDMPLLAKLIKNPNYNVIAEEEGFYLVVDKNLRHISGINFTL
ncbi:MAG: hypothetical protein ACOY4Q_03910 [Bacillota bacterium]